MFIVRLNLDFVNCPDVDFLNWNKMILTNMQLDQFGGFITGIDM